MQVSAEAKGHWMSGHSPFYFLETMSLTEPGIRLAGPAIVPGLSCFHLS